MARAFDEQLKLGYKNPSNALQVHVDSDDKTSYLIQVSGSIYKANTLFVNESGLYAGSRIKAATGKGIQALGNEGGAFSLFIFSFA